MHNLFIEKRGKSMKALSNMKIKSVVLSVIVALIITMMPITSFAANNVPANTKLTYCKLTDSREVTLKWKKVSGVTGYKVYRQTEHTNLKLIGQVKGASKLLYIDDTLDKYDYGAIKYLVRTYKTKNGKTKLSDKRFTNRKTVTIKDMAWNPETEPVNEEIYEAYKMARDISLTAKRALMLYGVNKERAAYYGDNSHALQQLDILNETAQEKCEEMSKIHEYAHTLSTIGSMDNQLNDKRNFKHYLESAENLCGDYSVAGCISQWMGSPIHRANLLRSCYTHLGFGCYDGYSAQHFIQYTQEEIEADNYNW